MGVKLFDWILKRISYARGQILETQEIGIWLIALSGLEEVKQIVEIGTWSGRGSSRLLLKGASNRSGCQIWGLEANHQMFLIAKRYLENKPFNLLWGSIVDAEELDSSNLTPEEAPWFEGDLKSLENTPNVLAQLPHEIDLLLLDGGEFSTYAEFKKLRSRIVNWLVLDDTNVRKNQRVLDEVLLDETFSLVHISNERNGTAVFKRIRNK